MNTPAAGWAQRLGRPPNWYSLASPSVNRHAQGERDVGEWVPNRNRCWFAGQVLSVKRRYGLTVDAREAAALGRVLAGCASIRMESSAA